MKNLIIIILFVSFLTHSHASDLVFKDKNGKVLTKNNLKGLTGKVNWEITLNLKIPSKAKLYHAQGRAYGHKGKNELAISNFKNAIELAPKWPYPYYDLAFTYLLKSDFDNAYKYYKKVNDLSPRGFFTTKTAVYYLGKEKRGELPKGVYLYYLSHEWTQDQKKKLQIFINLNQKYPSFAPAWYKRSNYEKMPNKRLKLIEKGLSVNPDQATKGFLLLNKAIVLTNTGKKSDAITILGTLALDPKSPLDIELLSKKTLAMILKL